LESENKNLTDKLETLNAEMFEQKNQYSVLLKQRTGEHQTEVSRYTAAEHEQLFHTTTL